MNLTISILYAIVLLIMSLFVFIQVARLSQLHT